MGRNPVYKTTLLVGYCWVSLTLWKDRVREETTGLLQQLSKRATLATAERALSSAHIYRALEITCCPLVRALAGEIWDPDT